MPDEKKTEEPTYPKERLIAEAQEFFGVGSHIVVGALHDNRKVNFTRGEVESAVASWLKRPVETDTDR